MDNIQTALIIKELCKKQKVTISRMLLDTSIRKGLIYDMEKRDLTPSAEVLEKIADYFDCSEYSGYSESPKSLISNP